MLLGPEEKASYEASISSLASLKAFHDAGIDVSEFEDFMIDVTFNDSVGMLIFKQGCEHLFFEVKEYSYEDKEILENYLKAGDLTYVPEYAFEIRDPKMELIFLSSQKELFKEFITKTAKNMIREEFYFDGDIIPLSNGFAVTMYWIGQFHEVTQAVILIYHEMNRLYELVKGENK